MDQAGHDCNRNKPLVRSFYTSRGHKLKIELFLNWNETVFLYFQTQNGVVAQMLSLFVVDNVGKQWVTLLEFCLICYSCQPLYFLIFLLRHFLSHF